MSVKNVYGRIKNKRDTATKWESNNPVLLDGELIVVDTSSGDVRFKIGDGVKKYTQLPFTDEKINTAINGKASTSSLTSHTGNTTVHITSSERSTWNAKANASDLTSHTGNKSNPHGVTLSQLGVTATAGELNYVDGVTSNIQTQLNNKAASSHRHKFNDLYGDGSAGSLDYITQCRVGEAASNKSFGLPADAITIEYSTDGGTTWLNYDVADFYKKGLFCETRSINFYFGNNATSGTGSVDMKLRVTIEATDRYCTFEGIYVYMGTSGNTCWMDVEYATYSDLNTFKPCLTKKELKGWSGPNIYYGLYLYFNKTNTSGHTRKIRMTFYSTEINTTYGCPYINDIRFYGGNNWGSPNPIVARNHMYRWDTNFNVTFPAKVTAAGGLSGALPATDVTQTDNLNFVTKNEKALIAKISTLESEITKLKQQQADMLAKLQTAVFIKK